MFGVFLFCWIQYRPNTLLCHCIQFSHSIQKLLRYKKAGRKGIAFRPAKWMQRYKAWLGWNVMCACNTVSEYLLEVHQKLPYCKAVGLDMLCRAQKSRWTGQQARTVSGSACTVTVSVAVKKIERTEKVLMFSDIKEKSHFSFSEKCEILAETERFEDEY